MKKLIGIKPVHDVFNYFDSDGLELKSGDIVVVQTIRGIQLGKVLTEVEDFDDKNVSGNEFKVLRVATDEDISKDKENLNEAIESLKKSKEIVAELHLDMRMVDAYYSLDKSQFVFNFVADNRVDFRELARKLAQIYKTRIELRQIGVRDKAKEVGGIGPCGRFLCCNTFLTDFDSVSINMAKNQDIALNPSKINGVCGRLLCCLKYEDSSYSELKKDFPNVGDYVKVDGENLKVVSLNLLKGKISVESKNKSIIEMDWDRDGSSE